jgi:hypothetical protein
MYKPPNVVNVYPLTEDRFHVGVPEGLQQDDGLIIYNIESDRADDIMHDKNQVYAAGL